MKSTDVNFAQGPMSRGKGACAKGPVQRGPVQRGLCKGAGAKAAGAVDKAHRNGTRLGLSSGATRKIGTCQAEHAGQGCARRGERDESQRIEEENRRWRELRRRLG